MYITVGKSSILEHPALLLHPVRYHAQLTGLFFSAETMSHAAGDAGNLEQLAIPMADQPGQCPAIKLTRQATEPAHLKRPLNI